VHYSASKVQTVDAIFFMPGWARCGSHKKCVEIGYVEIVFLHLMRSVGHIVDSAMFEARNVDTLFFIPEWA
jgi:hypothetical protein